MSPASIARVTVLIARGTAFETTEMRPFAPFAIICTVIPSFMIAEAISRIGPGPMSAVGGVGPVVAAWAAVMILHEPFGWAHMASMVLTIIGVWLLAKPRITRTAGARTW